MIFIQFFFFILINFIPPYLCVFLHVGYYASTIYSDSGCAVAIQYETHAGNLCATVASGGYETITFVLGSSSMYTVFVNSFSDSKCTVSTGYAFPPITGTQGVCTATTDGTGTYQIISITTGTIPPTPPSKFGVNAAVQT